MKARIDITDQRFGRWLVKAAAPSRGRCTFWRCRCDCGVERDVMTQSLRAGRSMSCGCLCREINSAKTNRKTHGLSKSPEYSVFCGMKRRCENENEKCYPRYGGKGTECRFISFEDFIGEVGPRPTKKHQIDRIDNNGHYEKGNVRWVTPKRQQRNRANNKIVSYRGRSLCLADLCDEKQISYQLVWQRVFRDGWSIERAVGDSQ